MTKQHRLNMRRANAWKFTKEILSDYERGDAILWIARKYKSDKRTIRQVLKEQGILNFRGRKGITAWNKGLTQFEDKRILKWSGKNHYCWKGGITPLMVRIRRCSKYRWWVKNVLERDDYICQTCEKRGGDLQADHYPKDFSDIIKENKITTFERAINCKELWDTKKGRTLCKPCHRKTFKFKGNQSFKI